MIGMTSVNLDDHPERALLDRLEQYYDAVPLSGARAERHGPLTLFVREGEGWRPVQAAWDGAATALAALDGAMSRIGDALKPFEGSAEMVDDALADLATAMRQRGEVGLG